MSAIKYSLACFRCKYYIETTSKTERCKKCMRPMKNLGKAKPK